ncbi:sucrose transport protein SUT1-like [Zingiber officinale]|uniref:sucrose transport protein SUT1-like n=1 Tax=Zingiber officinale TaxID=94328 RepID=UPI001C4D660D|nr:sucrose transport protein SUT1-like [Zingiber officinale]
MAGVGQREASGQGRKLELAEATHAGEAYDGESPVVAVKHISLTRLIFACMVTGGVQYGWALQLSLLTPYVQTLGLSHALSSIVWLCGPVAGFVVQPIIGLWSDRCQSRFGRRRPFIFVGCILISIAVIVLGFSSDIGRALGDTKEHCSVYNGPRWHAAVVYCLGFWLLDFSNNTVQGPTRALMADLSSHHGPNTANAIFASWMAAGNILGYLSGSSGSWHKWFPFLVTNACCEACANLKGAFLVAVVLLFITLTATLFIAKEVCLCDLNKSASVDQQKTSFFDVFRAFKNLPPGMPSVLLVTALTWLSWFPFTLYNTDWMGREIYYGKPKGTSEQIDVYDRGVREGALGLLLNSVVLGISSFLIAPMCRKLSVKVVWAISNFTLFVSMAAICIISVWSSKEFHSSAQSRLTADPMIRIVALAVFTILGFPLAVVYSIPFAVTAQLTANAEGGQGLCVGVLNVSIVIPQVIVALGAGPWDALFGKGNMPAFALASAIAFVCSIVVLFVLPRLSKSNYKTSGVSGGH